jgi:hypothetical protein
MIFIIFHSGGQKSPPAFSRQQIPLKIEGGHGKSQGPPLSYSDLVSYQMYSFFDTHEDVACVPPRFSWENWTFVNNPRSQPLKVWFLPRINQVWSVQSPIAHPIRFHSAVCQNERWLSGWFRSKSQAPNGNQV